ncbi:triacylglycerol lipase [Corallococcus sp. CA053C]|uniref:lipase family alpha/beta hydrolase n=1 Tax=Corallococcus sp. CA053C TaxID=2316732 RepID=UPI000EA1B609|nr:triacylglycerol lipase [Corallococcus sp. CA053C]RKH14971.1 triacylglycerol lipase [Corallococcus sp. CA053C]
MRNAVRTLVLTVAVLALWAQPARADTYTQTKYPIVLAHGMAGFDSLFGVLDYFYGIESNLKSGGARVYITHVPQFNTSEARGEALLAQVQDVLARTGAAKVNLIGHSHGGLDVRYVAAVRPDLVASVTTVGTPHKGAELADYLRAHISGGSFTESVLGYFASSLGTVLGLLSGHTQPQDAIAALGALTKTGTSAFSAKFPAGLPTTSCGSGAATGTQGQRYYSWSGTDPFTNVLDASDYALKLSSFFYADSNDGLVGRCSSHFGTVLRDNYDMNHLDEVNQVLGITAFFTDPKSVFRSQANRLKNAGL